MPAPAASTRAVSQLDDARGEICSALDQNRNRKIGYFRWTRGIALRMHTHASVLVSTPFRRVHSAGEKFGKVFIYLV